MGLTAESVCQRVRADLEGERDEFVQHGDGVATADVTAMCERIVRYIGVAWFQTPGLKWAAFGDGVGGASLILHCHKRRLDFQVSADGYSLMALRIDENMKAMSEWVSLDETHALAAWVCDGS